MHKTLNSVFFASLIAGVFIFTSCNKKADEQKATDSSVSAQQVKSGTGKGVVISIDSGRANVELSHNDIPGIMEAMSMSYSVAKPTLLDNVAKGDSVAFTLTEPAPGEFVVTTISVMPKK